MGKKFVIAMLSVMIVFAAYLSEFIPVGFPVPKGTKVYAVLGDKRIQLSDEDAEDIIYILRNEYWKDNGGNCPFDHDFNIGFEAGNNRYAIAMDSYVYVAVYSLDGVYRCSGGSLYVGRPAAPYYYKYFDDDDISGYFKHIEENEV